MKICLINFFRNRICNLTIASIKYFIKDADIYVVNRFLINSNKNKEKYNELEKLNIKEDHIFYDETKLENTGTSYYSSNNGALFSEGYNLAYEHFKDLDDKLLMLCEDHFFTNGSTLAELEKEDFIFAYAPTESEINGSILCINPIKMKNYFPIPIVYGDTVERFFRNHFLTGETGKFHILSTRKVWDYCRDGFCVNDEKIIALHLIKAGILNKDSKEIKDILDAIPIPG